MTKLNITAENAKNAKKKYKYLKLKAGENTLCDVECGLKKFLSHISDPTSFFLFLEPLRTLRLCGEE